ncbi:MAG: DUF3791 domain-containing protein [Bacteroides sp.]|nr:DUF3791 domain-containing protein [Bacteroides sp.]
MMTQEQRATEFVVFGIENTAKRVGCSGYEVFQELQRTNGIEQFLYPSYSMLHTQGKEYIVDEVLGYILQRNPHFLSNLENKC